MSENPASQPGGWNPPKEVTEGAFKGWSTWGNESDPFETLTGPYFMKADGKGGYVCAFMPDAKNCNGMGNIHGGALMTFADFALFAHAHDHMNGQPCVTVQFESQFVGAAKPFQTIESIGEVVRVTKSMIFVRGLMSQAGRPVLSYSGMMKRIGV
jgi:acyl-coenzyme A thioesterase 13